MKKISTLIVLTVVLFAPVVLAQEGMHAGHSHMGEHGEMMKVYQCSMDGYTSEKAGECPLCGMDLEEKEMPADEAKAALEKSKSE